MYQNVSHFGDLLPWDLRLGIAKVRGEPRRGFADDLDVQSDMRLNRNVLKELCLGCGKEFQGRVDGFSIVQHQSTRRSHSEMASLVTTDLNPGRMPSSSITSTLTPKNSSRSAISPP